MRCAISSASANSMRLLAGIADVADDAVGQFAAQVVAALAADGEDFDRLALGLQPARQVARGAADVGVEGAGQAAIGGDRRPADASGPCRCRPAAAARSGCRPPRRPARAASAPSARRRGAPPPPAPARGAASTPRPSSWREVIFCVDLTLLMRSRRAFRLGMSIALRPERRSASAKPWRSRR